jgi:secreted trypsin-like serine protease
MRNPITPLVPAGVLAVLLSSIAPALGLTAPSPGRRVGDLRAHHAVRWHRSPHAGGSRLVRRSPRANGAIVGGEPAQAGTFASVAEVIDIRGAEEGQCTGTVVAPNLVLTAGHCAENVKTGIANGSTGYRVLTGGVEETSERQTSTVLGVLVYEGYARKVDDGDAALLVLSTATAAPPVRLATAADGAKLHAGSRATIAGWGETRDGQSGPTPALNWASTVVQGKRWCKHNAPPFYPRSEICAIDPPRYATGACNGDSGGPLLAHAPGGALLEVGIVVHGYDACSTRLPTVFTRVAPLASWVQTWIDAYKVAPSSPSS